VGKDVKRVSGDDFWEGGDYSDAVLGIRGLEEGCRFGRERG
jgi:hypothetical protein